MSKSWEELRWFLEYQLKLAARHRHYVSVVLVQVNDENFVIDQLLHETIRESDYYSDFDDSRVIIMTHSSREETERAVARIKSTCNGAVDLRYAISCYPNDATSAKQLLNSVVKGTEDGARSGIDSAAGAG